MLKIKLAKFGKRHQPHYRIVVIEQREKRDGAYTDLLGHYAPSAQPKLLQLDLVAYDKWLSQGAQPTDTVASLARRLRSTPKIVAKQPAALPLAKQVVKTEAKTAVTKTVQSKIVKKTESK